MGGRGEGKGTVGWRAGRGEAGRLRKREWQGKIIQGLGERGTMGGGEAIEMG